MEFGYNFDYFESGRNEDGEPVLSKSWFVVATHDDGRRWRMYVANEAVAKYTAEDLDAGLIDGKVAARHAKSSWVEDVPVYGSASHDEFALYDEDDWAIFARY